MVFLYWNLNFTNRLYNFIRFTKNDIRSSMKLKKIQNKQRKEGYVGQRKIDFGFIQNEGERRKGCMDGFI